MGCSIAYLEAGSSSLAGAVTLAARAGARCAGQMRPMLVFVPLPQSHAPPEQPPQGIMMDESAGRSSGTKVVAFEV